jgi:hypothetical protein|tara:strand:- start:2279 stop:2632 length:354 start_codon:yes stop_codon:yes gene_type:complete
MLELETVFTVLSTIGVGALTYAFAGVIRLNGRVNELELLRMEIIDLEQQIDRKDTEYNQNMSNLDKDTNRRIDDEQTMAKSALSRLERNLDKRFDNVWSEIHTLDKTVNPNKDLLKD